MFGNEWNCSIYQESVLGSGKLFELKEKHMFIKSPMGICCLQSSNWGNAMSSYFSESTGLSPAFWNCFKNRLVFRECERKLF